MQTVTIPLEAAELLCLTLPSPKALNLPTMEALSTFLDATEAAQAARREAHAAMFPAAQIVRVGGEVIPLLPANYDKLQDEN